jgi:predicted ribonuclease toxin of YeeF-YezG toxin-antitoxin module
MDAALNKELLNEIYAALQAVSDVLSKVPDADWDKVTEIQSHVSQDQELISKYLDKLEESE